MSNYCDPSGYNKQTATLLRGLGAPELIPECKKRNISIYVLHELSVQELIMLGKLKVSQYIGKIIVQLIYTKQKNSFSTTLNCLQNFISNLRNFNVGVNCKKAAELKTTLNVKRRRSAALVTNVEDRIQHFLDIIKQGEQQLCLIQAFVAYCRLRLLRERCNTFIDPNKCLSASEILPISVRATLTEIEDAKKSLSELEAIILGSRVKPKRNNIRRVCTFISGLGILTLVLLKIRDIKV